MKKLLFFLLLALLPLLCKTSCEKDSDPGAGDPDNVAGKTIAGYQVATQEALRAIPVEYINAARTNLHVAYQHTSHGTHVSYGLYGLQDFKTGDDVLFGITKNDPQAGKLDFRDCEIDNYGSDPITARDLGDPNETAFIQATRNYLDNSENAAINVVMWSWCSIKNHDVTVNYLPGMQMLIDEYGEGGTKVGSGAGKRANAVTFVFMTGHAEVNANVGTKLPMNQADTIIGYCNAKSYYCLDYYGIDTHDMADNYLEDAGDDGNSDDYGGNFYVDWQNAHVEGTDYFNNKSTPGGSVTYGDHNTQHITANRKAYAMWYILARIAGWDGETTK
jgi:hypothetical protein